MGSNSKTFSLPGCRFYICNNNEDSLVFSIVSIDLKKNANPALSLDRQEKSWELGVVFYVFVAGNMCKFKVEIKAHGGDVYDTTRAISTEGS